MQTSFKFKLLTVPSLYILEETVFVYPTRSLKNTPTHKAFNIRLKSSLASQGCYNVNKFLAFHWETVLLADVP